MPAFFATPPTNAICSFSPILFAITRTRCAMLAIKPAAISSFETPLARSEITSDSANTVHILVMPAG